MKINGKYIPLKSGTTNTRLGQLGVINYLLSARVHRGPGLPFPLMMSPPDDSSPDAGVGCLTCSSVSKCDLEAS